MNVLKFIKKLIDRVVGQRSGLKASHEDVQDPIEGIARQKESIVALRLAHEDQVRRLIKTSRWQAPP